MSNDTENQNGTLPNNLEWIGHWYLNTLGVKLIIMIIGFILYVFLVVALVKNYSIRHIPIVYCFLLMMLFSAFWDGAVLVEQAVNVAARITPIDIPKTDLYCRFMTYLGYGATILQSLIVVPMLYYAWLNSKVKKEKFEAKVRKFFPFVILAIMIVHFGIMIWAGTQHSGNGKHCTMVDSSWVNRRWIWGFYNVLFPYYIPLAFALYPMIKLILKLRNDQTMNEPTRTQMKITVAMAISFFGFCFPVYTTWLVREIRVLAHGDELDNNLTNWFIVRPIFETFGYFFHIAMPIVPFIYDRRFENSCLASKCCCCCRRKGRVGTEHDALTLS